jgi:hypothetical protein
LVKERIMTVEELKEFLEDENNKAVFEEIVKDLGYESQDDIQGLKSKNDQLLAKLKKKKDEFEEKQKLLDGIDIDAYNEYINGDKGKDNNSELNKIKRELKESNDLIEKFKKIEDDYNNALKLNAVKDALIENKIDSRHTKILTSAFMGKAKVEIDGDARNIIIDDDGLGLPPKEFFKKWTETETGKAYLAKPENKGGENTPLGSSGVKMSRQEFEKRPATERMSLIEKGTIITD